MRGRVGGLARARPRQNTMIMSASGTSLSVSPAQWSAPAPAGCPPAHVQRLSTMQPVASGIPIVRLAYGYAAPSPDRGSRFARRSRTWRLPEPRIWRSDQIALPVRVNDRRKNSEMPARWRQKPAASTARARPSDLTRSAPAGRRRRSVRCRLASCAASGRRTRAASRGTRQIPIDEGVAGAIEARRFFIGRSRFDIRRH